MRKLPILAALAHAFRSVWNNFPVAWHMSWPWLAVLMPLGFLVERHFPLPRAAATDPEALAQQQGPMMLFVLIGMLSMLAYSSIAVNWHRYILKDEVPQGFQRLRLDGLVWRYLGNTVLIMLAVVLVLLPVVTLASLVIAMSGLPAGPAGTLVIVVSALVALPLTYRMFIRLPAIAMLNDAISLKEALRLTAGNSLQLCLAGFIIFCAAMFIATLIGGLLSPALGESAGGGAIVFSLVQQLLSWVFTLFSVTFLTSLYGFFVEGRDF